MSMKVMVVDSTPEIVPVVKDIFEPNCRVMHFSDGALAAAALQTQKFGAVFLEAQPPQIDGFELARRVRSSRSNSRIPIVMMTVFYDTQTMLDAFRAGVNLFVAKPISREQVNRLYNAVHSSMLLDHRRYIRAPFKGPVRCTARGKFEDCPAVNLSTGGMLLKTATLGVGESVEIEFKVPQSTKPLKVRAEVVRNEATGTAAVRFIGVAADTRDLLTRYASSAAGLQLAS
jgi:CheY-like chemotaxis protein